MNTTPSTTGCSRIAGLALLFASLGSALMYGGEIHKAARSGDLAKVQTLTAADAKSVSEKDENGRTALWAAVQKNRIEVVRFLLANGAEANACDKDNIPVLFTAVGGGRKEIVELLLEKGASVNICDTQKQTPLHIAASSGRTEIAALLLEKGADVNAATNYKLTPLHMATWQPKQDMVDLLLERGAKPDAAYNEGGTALQNAANGGRTGYVAALLKKGANPDLANNEGETALHMAVRSSQLETLQLLLGAAKNLNPVEKHYGQTPMHWASLYGYQKLAAALQERGADISVKDAKGRTALELACRYGQTDIATMLAAKSGTQPKVVSAAAELAQPTPKGQALVWYCGHSGWAVKTNQHLLVFDYYRGGSGKPTAQSLQNGYINPEELRGLKITVFVSHEHGDHFDPAILKWKEAGLDVDYVYGFTPRENKNQKYTGPVFTYVGPQEQKDVGGMSVAGIKSLDTGGGFLVKVDGLVVFHAGDHANLNTGTRAAYDKEINYLATLTDHVDLAFLPVSGCPSSWQREQVIAGFFSATTTLKAKTVFPMHGMQREWDYCEFATLGKTRTPSTQILCAEFPGDLFRYEPAAKVAATK